MKDEIKEILDKLINSAEHYILYDYEAKILLEYITNLQEEKRKLLEDKDSWHRVAQKNYNEMQDKIDKAIEYIKKHCDYGYAGQKCLTDVLYCYEAEELLEILQGKSDE